MDEMYYNRNMNSHSLCERGSKMDKVMLTRENGISTITLNRPESYNALDIDMLIKLEQLINEVKENDDPIVLLTGAGKAFSAGGDIKMMTNIKTEEQFGKLMDALTEIAVNLYLLPKIVITAVNGSIAGLGLSIALASDYIVAHEKAKLGVLFAGIGLIPDGGGHFFLKERLGTHQAKQFIWSLEQINAKEGQKMGLIDFVTEEQAETAALEIAQKVKMSPFQAIIRSKMILHEAKKEELKAFLAKEKIGQMQSAQTEDHKEGIQAFLEKRLPHFQGK